MRTLFAVRNTTGETWPAFAMGLLGDIILTDGASADIPLYELKKPDGENGIYVVNGGGAVIGGNQGTAIYYQDSRYVLVKGSEDFTIGQAIGAVADQWEAGGDEGGKQHFQVINNVKSDDNVVPIVPISSSGGGGGDTITINGDGCQCLCLNNGDLVLSGIETTSKWSVVMIAQTFEDTNGDIILPAGSYVVVWDSGLGKWTLDIGDELIARFPNSNDATSVSTLDGTLTLEWAGIGSVPSLKLCVSGTIPPYSGS